MRLTKAYPSPMFPNTKEFSNPVSFVFLRSCLVFCVVWIRNLSLWWSLPREHHSSCRHKNPFDFLDFLDLLDCVLPSTCVRVQHVRIMSQIDWCQCLLRTQQIQTHFCGTGFFWKRNHKEGNLARHPVCRWFYFQNEFSWVDGGCCQEIGSGKWIKCRACLNLVDQISESTKWFLNNFLFGAGVWERNWNEEKTDIFCRNYRALSAMRPEGMWDSSQLPWQRRLQTFNCPQWYDSQITRDITRRRMYGTFFLEKESAFICHRTYWSFLIKEVWSSLRDVRWHETRILTSGIGRSRRVLRRAQTLEIATWIPVNWTAKPSRTETVLVIFVGAMDPSQ